MNNLADLRLKPCPFCGREAVKMRGNKEHEWQFVCADYYDDVPECSSQPMTHIYDIVHEAVKEWNTRFNDRPHGKLVGYLTSTSEDGQDNRFCALKDYDQDIHATEFTIPVYADAVADLSPYPAMPIAYRWLSKPDQSDDIWSYTNADKEPSFTPEFKNEHKFQAVYAEELRTHCSDLLKRLATSDWAYEAQHLQLKAAENEIADYKKRIATLEAEVKAYKATGVIPANPAKDDGSVPVIDYKLKPKDCPWCYSTPKVTAPDHVNYKVVCSAQSNDEHCICSPETAPHYSKEAAIADWNRTIDQKVIDGFTRGEIAEVLRPFASFAGWIVDDDGWTDTNQRQPITTWFGPSDFRAIMKLAIALKDFNPNMAYRDSDLLTEIGILKREIEKLEKNDLFTREWHAVRLRKIEEIAKRENLWDEIAAVIANGQSTRTLPDGTHFIDPDNFGLMLNSAKFRADAASQRADRYKIALKIIKRVAGQGSTTPSSIIHQVIDAVEYEEASWERLS
jgi:cell division protein FtsB